LSKVLSKSLLLAAFLLLPLFFVNIRSTHNWGDDFAQYIKQAINLAEGKPQNYNCYIYNPDYPFYAPPLYPVGYPLLLAPVYLLCGNSLAAFNYLQTLCLFIFGISLFFFCKRWMDFLPALLLMLVAVYNPWMLEFKTEIISDLPLSLFFLLSGIAYLNFRDNPTWSHAAICGFLTGFTMLIKLAGVVLVAAYLFDILLTHFWRKESRSGVLRKAILLFGVPIMIYFLVNVILIPSSSETAGHFYALYQTSEKLNKRLNINATYYMELFQELFKYTNPGWELFGIVTKAFVLTFMLIGFFGKVFNRFGFLEILMLLYLPLVLFFPNITQGFRYLLPLLPMMLLYVFHGFDNMQTGKWNKKFVFVAACLFCLFQYKTVIIEDIWKNRHHPLPGPQEPASQEAFDFIIKNTEPDAVIAFTKPRALSLYTNRKALTNHPSQDLNGMKKFFEKNNVSYYLLNRDMDNPAFSTFLEQRADSLIKVWSNHKYTLLKKAG